MILSQAMDGMGALPMLFVLMGISVVAGISCFLLYLLKADTKLIFIVSLPTFPPAVLLWLVALIDRDYDVLYTLSAFVRLWPVAILVLPQPMLAVISLLLAIRRKRRRKTPTGK